MNVGRTCSKSSIAQGPSFQSSAYPATNTTGPIGVSACYRDGERCMCIVRLVVAVRRAWSLGMFGPVACNLGSMDRLRRSAWPFRGQRLNLRHCLPVSPLCLSVRLFALAHRITVACVCCFRLSPRAVNCCGRLSLTNCRVVRKGTRRRT